MPSKTRRRRRHKIGRDYMAAVSGRLLFDSTRTASPPTGMTGIANIPVALQSTTTGHVLAVYTDTSGNFSFTNVPNDSYHVIEAYGTPAVSTPGDFNAAAASGNLQAAVPPIGYAPSPPAGATNLDCTTRNTLPVNVTGANIANLYICNGPVRYSPLVVDPSVVVDDANIINIADTGSFGLFPAGTPVMTGANPNPYPGIAPDFAYVLPAAGSSNPSDGEYTIQNIATSITYQQNNVWWRIADYSTGNETGRLMIINGANPNTSFFTDEVFVKPNTYYLFTTWILNLVKITGRVNPQIGVKIVEPDGTILFNEDIGATIPVNSSEPEWHEIGIIIRSGNFSTLEVQFLSIGPAASGNDYAIDEIALYEVDVPLYKPVKTATPDAVNRGDTIEIAVLLTNGSNLPMTNINFTDLLPDGLRFVAGSVTINGTGCTNCDPNAGFSVPDLAVGESVNILFEVVADHVPWHGIATNMATITYQSQLVGGMAPVTLTVDSNAVDISVTQNKCAFVSIALQCELNGQGIASTGNVVMFDSPIYSKGGIYYRPDGTIDIAQPGTFIAAWFAAGMAGFATDGQLYKVRRFDYGTSTWYDMVGAGNHIKNSITTGHAVFEVTHKEIEEYGRATIALYNCANADAELTFFQPKAGIMVYGADFGCVRSRMKTIYDSFPEISGHLSKLWSFLSLSEEIKIFSQTAELMGLGVAVIFIGYNYNFWGIGVLASAQSLSAGTAYYLITAAQFEPLIYYEGDTLINTLWIRNPDGSYGKYPLKFDGTGIYFVPESPMIIGAGTKFSFTGTMILTEPVV